MKKGSTISFPEGLENIPFALLPINKKPFDLMSKLGLQTKAIQQAKK